jgi:hypothetical protein
MMSDGSLLVIAGERFVVRRRPGDVVVVDHVATWRRKTGTAPEHLAHVLAKALAENLLVDLAAVRTGELPADQGVFAPEEERNDAGNPS